MSLPIAISVTALVLLNVAATLVVLRSAVFSSSQRRLQIILVWLLPLLGAIICLVRIDIYRSNSNSSKYLSVPAGTDVTKLSVPEEFDKDLISLSPFKSEHEIVKGKPYIALNPDDVINQIEKSGYAIHGATISIQIGSSK
ncbi:hypothetical protein ABHF54_02500 [Nitrosomonas europaea]|uniref:hypothetical protein n=1 Tax=Nitrosomonas europaea TaxID=915 RepID=UPI0032636430